MVGSRKGPTSRCAIQLSHSAPRVRALLCPNAKSARATKRSAFALPSVWFGNVMDRVVAVSIDCAVHTPYRETGRSLAAYQGAAIAICAPCSFRRLGSCSLHHVIDLEWMKEASVPLTPDRFVFQPSIAIQPSPTKRSCRTIRVLPQPLPPRWQGCAGFRRRIHTPPLATPLGHDTRPESGAASS